LDTEGVVERTIPAPARSPMLPSKSINRVRVVLGNVPVVSSIPVKSDRVTVKAAITGFFM
jgi:hypothetical protein